MKRWNISLGINEITKELDIILAILGIISSLILIISVCIFLSEIASRYIGTLIMLFLVCVFYLLIRNKIYEMGGLSYLDNLHSNCSITHILNILFVLLISYSFFLVITRPEPYSRPLGYFIITSIIATILGLEIFFLPKKLGYVYVVMLKIMLVALSLRWTPQWIFPGLLGIDPWWHQMFTVRILDLGYIPDGYAYSKLPVMHLIISLTSLLTGLGYKLSAMLSIDFLQVVSLIFIFLLGKYIINEKIGLSAALLVGIADMEIDYGVAIRPMTVGIILIPILLYIILKAKQDRSIILTSLFIVISMVLILTHALAALCMAILLLLFSLTFEIYKKAYHVKFSIPSILFIAILYTVEMYGWWIYVAEHYIVQIGKLINEGFLISGGGFAIKAQSNSIKDVFEVILSEFGFSFIIILSILGSFYILTKQNVKEYSFSLIVGGYVFLFIAFLSLIAGLHGLLPGRWYPVIQLLIAIQATVGLFLVCVIFKSKLKKTLILIILFLILSFFEITSPFANMDNPIYSKNITSRFAFTDSELTAINTISDICEGSKVGIDQYPTYYLTYYLEYTKKKSIFTKDITPYILSKNFVYFDNIIIIIREYIIKNPFVARERGTTKIDYDPQRFLDEQGFNCIYSSKSVSAFCCVVKS